MQRFKAIERRQRLADAHQVALADGGDEQQIAVLRKAAEQGLGALQRLCVPAFLLPLAQAWEFGFYPGGRGGLHGEGRKHCFFEKKKQKTFACLASTFPERLGPGFKSFLVLFFRKELLS
jgi:hypothetical protein